MTTLCGIFNESVPHLFMIVVKMFFGGEGLALLGRWSGYSFSSIFLLNTTKDLGHYLE
jgi:hypothetical protein